MKRKRTERKYDVNGLDRCLVSFVPAQFIGSSGGGIAQVVHCSAVEQVVTLTAGVTVYNLLEKIFCTQFLFFCLVFTFLPWFGSLNTKLLFIA